MKATSMAKMSIEIYKKIDQLTKKQQVLDLQYLLKHYANLKALGMSDSFIMELLSMGVLQATVKEVLLDV